MASGSGGGRSRRYLVEREEKINAICSSLTPEEWQEKINVACSSLVQIGFSPKLFTIKNLRSFGYTEIDFLDLIEPISHITNLEELRHLFDTALDASLIFSPNEFLEFVNCVKWLNGEQDKKNMADALLAKKNPQKKKEMSKHDVVLAQMLYDYAISGIQERKRIQSEIDELKKRKNELETESASSSADYVVSGTQERKRIKIEIDIDELKKRLKDLEAESARITDGLKEKLGPIYDYEEPSLTELRSEAYKIYVTDCRFKGFTATPELDEMGYAKVVDVFGGIVKDRHFVKFLNDPVRRELIENYFKEYAGGGGDDKKKGAMEDL